MRRSCHFFIMGASALVLILAVAACKQEEASQHFVPATFKGVGFTPRSFDSTGMAEFFHYAGYSGGTVMWAGDWLELSDSTQAPDVVAQLARARSHPVLIAAQFFSQGTGELLRPLSDSVKQVYVSGATRFAQKYHLEGIAFGIEINILYEHSQSDFDSFAAFFPRVVDAVKIVSPATEVLTVFQLEHLRGLRGGLFGGSNDTSASDWSLLDRFPSADLIGFTTYPSLVFHDPVEIPADYYSTVRGRVSKRIAWTEIGWHSAAEPTGWESSETEQAAYVSRFLDMVTAGDCRFMIWSFLYDPQAAAPFNSMGLFRRTDGQPKPAWEVWRNH
jgi:hypothetical protein